MFGTNRALLGIALAAAAGLTACGGTADAATSAERTGRPTGTSTTITVTPPPETTTVTPPAETTTVTETVAQPPRTRTLTRTRTRTATVTTTETATVSDAAGDSLVGSSGDNATGDDTGGSLYYVNCSAARAAGDTPLFAGDPGYASHLDRDDDGVACE